MKQYFLIALCVLFAACNNTPKVDLTIKAPGIKNGSAVFKQLNDPIITLQIKDGVVSLNKPIETPGYYNVTILNSEKLLSSKVTFDVYLENGTYTIELKDEDQGRYPAITSSSKTQQQLSDYYKIENEMAGSINNTINSSLIYLETSEGRNLPKKDRSALITKTRGFQIERRKMEPAILSAYIAKHPNNMVAAHIMSQQYLDEYSVEYSAILQKLTTEAKNTPDGQAVADKLSVLSKLLPGSEAPNIFGATPNGSQFSKTSLKGKIVLVEFWVSNSEVSHRNHSKIINGLILSDSDKKHFDVVSVSTDTDSELWKKTIKNSNLTWAQVADFKGNASPNLKNWKITALPTYFLVDGNWRIIKPNIDIIDVDQEVHDYLIARNKK